MWDLRIWLFISTSATDCNFYCLFSFYNHGNHVDIFVPEVTCFVFVLIKSSHRNHFVSCYLVFGNCLTLSPLAVSFEDRWWPLQTIWIQMKPHKMWGFIWDPNCLTFRLYISKIFGRKHWFFASFERKKYLKKLPSMQRVNSFYSIHPHGKA